VTRRQALVIGGSSDIGTAVAAELAGLGHAVTVWGRDTERLRAAADTVDVVDVRDHAALPAAVRRVADRGPLGVVVHAAGIFDWGPADTADPGTWAELIAVNLTSAVVLTPLVLPHLLAAAPSALVFIGSGAAHQAYPNNAAYVASKHGLAGLAAATFLDVRDRDVKVSTVSPGLVAAGAGLWSAAGQERPERLLAPADVASAVRFVVTFPARGCPTEIRLQPQRSPG
jgi:NADP-dependent 3-hydroxy acid dehydrogenase YdfG